MNDLIKKVLTEAATQGIPVIAERLLTRHFNIPDLTLDEYVKTVFLANPSSPQCFRLRTRVPPEKVFETCLPLFAGMKAKISHSTTKDGWPLMFAEIEEVFFRRPGLDRAARLYVVGALKEGDATTAVVGCRFTEGGGWDVFKWLEKGAVRKVLEVVKAIDPGASPEKMTKG